MVGNDHATLCTGVERAGDAILTDVKAIRAHVQDGIVDTRNGDAIRVNEYDVSLSSGVYPATPRDAARGRIGRSSAFGAGY